MTSDVIKVQVKGGNRWRRANGYSVPVGRHRETWANGNIPVYCVVYDPALKQLYWANATQQLRRSGYMHSPEAIGISPSAVLNDATMTTFVAQARRYVGRYRGRQAVLTHLEEIPEQTSIPRTMSYISSMVPTRNSSSGGGLETLRQRCCSVHSSGIPISSRWTR